MSDVCFVFASAVEKDANKVINKYLKGVDYEVKFLHSGKKEKILKKDCVYLDHRMQKVHVSGHPSKQELKKMYEWVSPNALIPVHGEYRHLKEQVNFSKSCGVNKQLLIQNGDVIEMDEDVTNKLFLSPQGTIEKRRKLQQEVANEDELTLPSQDKDDDGDNQKSDKPAVAKLDQYLKNHK